MYCSVNKWNPKEYRSNLQALFFIMNILVLVGHISAGLVTSQTLKTVVYLIPSIAIGFIIGSLVHTKINPDHFKNYVYIMLLLMGIVLIINL